jgi:hypothetical protein
VKLLGQVSDRYRGCLSAEHLEDGWRSGFAPNRTHVLRLKLLELVVGRQRR